MGRTFAAYYLKKQHGFKTVRISDGVAKMMRYMYMYGKYERPKWERRMDFYDALYKIDNNIHIQYLLRRLETTTNDVVVDDVRYVSEILALKKAGFLIIRISGPERGKRRNITNTLREAAAGASVLHEYFTDSKALAYTTDYSIYNETKDGTRKSLDEILDIERNRVV